MSLHKETFEIFAQRLNSDNIGYLTESEKNYANNIDYFQLHYSRYLCGFVKTRHRTFEEFRQLKDNHLFKQSVYKKFLKEIEAFFLNREMYESLILFVATNKKLEKIIELDKKTKRV